MSRRILVVAFLLVLLGGIVARLPLAAALAVVDPARLGVSWRGVEGSIWHGRLTGLGTGPVPLGTATLGLSPAELLQGRAGGTVRLDGGPVVGAARVGLGLDGRAVVNDGRMRLALDALLPRLGLSGMADISLDRLVLSPAGCRDAAGDVVLTPALPLPDGGRWQAPRLAGRLACLEDGRLSLPLSGASAEARVDLTADLSPATGQWRLDLRVADAGADLRRGLTLAGFQPDGPALRLTLDGRMRPFTGALR